MTAGRIAVAAAVVATAILFNALALSLVWGWFVTPLGPRELPLAHAAGLLTLSLFLLPYPKYTEKDSPALFFYFYVRPAVVILVGWIIHLFM